MQIIARVQQIQALIFGTFWNSFPQQYFPPSVVADIEGQLYWISLWVTQRTKAAKGKSRNNSLRTKQTSYSCHISALCLQAGLSSFLNLNYLIYETEKQFVLG